jgi:Tfp pilus assembly protein PilN
MRAVNLLPEDTNARRIGKPGLVPVVGTAATLAAIGLVVGLAHVESGTVSSKQARLDSLKQQLASVQAPTQTASNAGAALLSSRDARMGALNSALAARIPWDVVLHQLGAVMPADTWLDSLQMTSPTAATAAGAPAAAVAPGAPVATGVTITGYTPTPESLARVLQRLGVITSLVDLKLTSSTRTTIGNKDVFQFSISANIATPGGAS